MARARGGNRGGTGGGYEKTNPNYVSDKVKRLRQEFKECPQQWKQMFLDGLSDEDRRAVLRKDRDAND